MPNHDTRHGRLLRISAFGFLSTFGIRISNFSYWHSGFFFVHDADDHPADWAFVVADGFAGGGAIGGKNDALMHGRAVRVYGDLRDAFGDAGPADRLANNQPPALEARVLASCGQIAFDAR
jgi:hypothetical protein